MKSQTPVILLAAGGSSRMGSAKQLLPMPTGTLLGHAVSIASSAAPGNTFLVLGAASDEILLAVDTSKTRVIINDDWKEGIASSIRAGLNAVLAMQSPEQVILMVCDQPFLTARHLWELNALAAASLKGIIASGYKQTAGTPVLFKRQYFDDLLNLQGDEGARKLFSKHAADLLVVSFEHGDVDIDTALDYEKLKGHANRYV